MQPEKLGPFQIGRVLGRGGMGAVYEGVNEQTDEHVAVKVLLSTLEEDADIRRRFEAEIDTLKRLRHPNIVRLFGFGEEQDLLYYVMELVDGPSLHHEMRKQRLFEWHEVAKIGLEMCFALKHGHDRGITHRDIKPANILLNEQGEIKLSDYGIAQFFGSEQRLTEIHSIVGTLEYMSPEQALGMPVGPRSDIYSLGAVLYALLAGKPPYSAKNLIEIIRKHQSNSFEPIRENRIDVPEEMDAIVLDLLKSQPEDRPHNTYLIAKRFQSLLQALVGPPERIRVKPMTPETPLRKPTGSVSFLDQNKEKEKDKQKIVPPRDPVSDDSIIDLGGIVSVPTETQNIVPKKIQPESPPGSTSLANSFGLHNSLSDSTKSHASNSLQQSDEIDSTGFLLADSVPPESDHSEFGVAAPVPEFANSHENDLALSDQDIEVVPPNSVDNIIDPKREEPTVRGLESSPKKAKKEPDEVFKSYDLQESPKEEEKKKSDKTSVYGYGEGITQHTATTSRFTKVDEKELDDYDSANKEPKPIISIQTILASISLMLIGIVIWYFLQPVPPNALYDRITRTLNIDDDSIFSKGDDYFQEDDSLKALRRASQDIKSFLEQYANHPRADRVRFFEDQLELANKERQLERYQQFSGPQRLIPVERAYLDAIASIKTDPERSISKLHALIDLYGSDNTKFEEENIESGKIQEKEKKPTGEDRLRQRLSRSEQCIEVARRRLKKLENDMAAVRADQMNLLKQRLVDADQIEKIDPIRADKIRLALIELYRDQNWAGDLVKQAEKMIDRKTNERPTPQP